MFTNVYEVENIEKPEHEFMKKGQVFLARNIDFVKGMPQRMEFVDLDGSTRILYDYAKELFMRSFGDDYKVIPSLRDVFKEVPVESLEGIEKGPFDGTLNMKGVTLEALEKLNPKPVQEKQPGEN